MTQNKMLQAILDGQCAITEELKGDINRVEKKVENVSDKLKQVEVKLTERINLIGKQLAYLEDDSSTIEEFDNLEKRVAKVETTISPLK